MPNKKPEEPKRPRGRPPVHPMPEQIDASPEEIAEVVMRMSPKRDWRYVKVRDSAKSE